MSNKHKREDGQSTPSTPPLKKPAAQAPTTPVKQEVKREKPEVKQETRTVKQEARSVEPKVKQEVQQDARREVKVLQPLWTTSRKVPEGKTYKKPCYHNNVTGHTQWDKPADFPGVA